MIITDSELIGMATDFLIDDQLDVSVSQRAEHSWAICRAGECLSSITGEWEYESMPSSRTEEYKKEYRFSSPKEAILVYRNWKSKQWFAEVYAYPSFGRGKREMRWCILSWSDKQVEMERVVDAGARGRPEMQHRLVAPGGKEIRRTMPVPEKELAP